ncbi:hypothetical protein PGAL8A_00240200 [Plasmodium gallinaceum]|uniref:Uncharacterized protein n=1 Tax=Plasmodium gallinaceum TaxID=5849 RepID=A0A1J1GRB6_PLAGA|nr:hypothetical protein PGAL8A_00240200 [Plasmodium gallinaceum]CRG95005.1 hypothetical protein PGAL8A_00240200 [Plasmodium gallinaceum]
MHFIKLQKIYFKENNSNSSSKKQEDEQKNRLNNSIMYQKKFTNEKQKCFIKGSWKILQDLKYAQNYILLEKSNEIYLNKNLKENKDKNNMVILNNIKFHKHSLNFKKSNIVTQHLEKDKKNKSGKNFVHPFDNLNYGKCNITREDKYKKEIHYYYNLIKVKKKFNNLLNEKYIDKVTFNFCNNYLNKTLNEFFKEHFIYKKRHSNENYKSFYNSNNILLDNISKSVKHNKFSFLNTLSCNNFDNNISRKFLIRENIKKKNYDSNIDEFKFFTSIDGKCYINRYKKIKKINNPYFDFHKNLKINKANIKYAKCSYNNKSTFNERNMNKIKHNISCLWKNPNFNFSHKFLNNSKVSINNDILKIKRVEEKSKTYKNGTLINSKGEKKENEPLISIIRKIDENLESNKIENKIKREFIKKSKDNNKTVNQKIYKKKKFYKECRKKGEKYCMYNSKSVDIVDEKADIIKENIKTENDICKKTLSKVKIYNSIKERELIDKKMKLNKMKNNILNENFKLKEKRHYSHNNFLGNFYCINKVRIKKEKNNKNIMNDLGKQNKENLFEIKKKIKLNFTCVDNLNENSANRSNLSFSKNMNNYQANITKTMNNRIFDENHKKTFHSNIEKSIKNNQKKLLKVNLGKLKSEKERRINEIHNIDILVIKKMENKFNEKEKIIFNQNEKIKIHKRLPNFKKLIKKVKKYLYINVIFKKKKRRKYLLKDIHFLKKYVYNFSQLKKNINKKNNRKFLKNSYTKNNLILNKLYKDRSIIKKHDQSKFKANNKDYTVNKMKKKIEKEKSSLKNLNDAECKIYILLENFSSERKIKRMK